MMDGLRCSRVPCSLSLSPPRSHALLSSSPPLSLPRFLPLPLLPPLSLSWLLACVALRRICDWPSCLFHRRLHHHREGRPSHSRRKGNHIRRRASRHHHHPLPQPTTFIRRARFSLPHFHQRYPPQGGLPCPSILPKCRPPLPCRHPRAFNRPHYLSRRSQMAVPPVEVEGSSPPCRWWRPLPWARQHRARSSPLLFRDHSQQPSLPHRGRRAHKPPVARLSGPDNRQPPPPRHHTP